MAAQCGMGRILVCRKKPKVWSKPCGVFRTRNTSTHRCKLTAAGKKLKAKARRARHRIGRRPKTARDVKHGRKKAPKRPRSSSTGGIASRIGQRRRVA